MSKEDCIRITGRLLKDARLMLRNDGTAEVHIVLRQEGAHIGCAHAVQAYGTGHANQYAAQRAAGRLRKSEKVTVHAALFDIVRGELQLLDVSHIAHDAAATDHSAPHKELAA